MRKNSTTWGMIAASGALVLTLAACGEDSPTVEEPTNGGNSAQTDEGTDADNGAETETDGTDTETDGTDADTGAETETDGTDTETDGTETDGTEEEGADAGTATEGEEVDPAAFVEQLKSPGMENMTTFSMNMDMNVDGQAITMTGKADLSGASPAMDFNMDMQGMTIQMIMVDGQAYMSMPGVTEEGQFIQMPLEEVMGEDSEDFTNQVDMTSQWDDWETGAQKITFIGPEDVDGETLNKYELLLDTTNLDLDVEDTTGMMPEEITYNVWLDDENYMRQVSFDVAGAETIMQMSDWGEPVDISAPTNITEMPTP